MHAFLLASAVALAQPHPHHDQVVKLGRVAFPTSCNAAANADFLRGVAWLHSFEYEQAESSFAQASAADPSCGIAQWGVAMSLYHPLWAPPSAAELAKGRTAIARALAVPAKSQRERDYVAAIATFYRGSDTLDHKTRALAYNQAMRDLHRLYPDDHEAAIFYALSQAAVGTFDKDPNFAREKDAAAILQAVLKAEPDHPGVAHYLIHSFDYPPLAELAVAAARHYAGIAPDSPHAQHMPSHIFTRLGMWDESIASNLKSGAAARALLKRKGFAGASREELHAMDYLAYAYLQTGRDKEAQRVLAQLNAIQRVDEPIFSVAYAATAIPARLALERRQWRDAARLELPDNVRALAPLQDFPWAEAHIVFARAVGAARSGDAAAATREVARLGAIADRLAVPPGTYDWKAQVGIERDIAAAWLAHAQGRDKDALALMRAAADADDALEKHPVTPGAILPAREQLGELLLEGGQPAAALAAFEDSLKRSPRRFGGLYGAARAAKRAGDAAKTRHYYAQLAQLTNGPEASRAEIREARSIGTRVRAKTRR
jgi:Tfp pilus assembly protein PilF